MTVAVRGRELSRAELSIAERLSYLPLAERRRVLAETFPDEDAAATALYSWKFWGRPKQLAPLDELDAFVIMVRTGRGFGRRVSERRR